jgi:hypothetical protein
MHITHDFTLAFDMDEYVSFHGQQYARLLARPAVRAEVESVFAEVGNVVQPAACWDVFPIEGFVHDRVRLAGGRTLGGGPVVEVVCGAEALALAVVTVGPAVDERIRQLNAERQRFQALVLDELASWAVDQVRQQLYAQMSAAFQARGWRTSTFLSPGESAWSVREQRVLFKLLDAGQIGVSLSDSYLMTPLKSLSLMCGAGSQPLGVEGLTNCDFCSIKDRCTFARSGGHGKIPLHSPELP